MVFRDTSYDTRWILNQLWINLFLFNISIKHLSQCTCEKDLNHINQFSQPLPVSTQSRAWPTDPRSYTHIIKLITICLFLSTGHFLGPNPWMFKKIWLDPLKVISIYLLTNLKYLPYPHYITKSWLDATREKPQQLWSDPGVHLTRGSICPRGPSDPGVHPTRGSTRPVDNSRLALFAGIRPIW